MGISSFYFCDYINSLSLAEFCLPSHLFLIKELICFTPCCIKRKQSRRKKWHMSQRTTKPTKWHVRPAKPKISQGIRPVRSESSLCAQLVAKDPSFRNADRKDSDQTGRTPRLIWVFAGRTCHFVGFVIQWLICSCHFSQTLGMHFSLNGDSVRPCFLSHLR